MFYYSPGSLHLLVMMVMWRILLLLFAEEQLLLH
jgi:hypothetical protein